MSTTALPDHGLLQAVLTRSLRLWCRALRFRAAGPTTRARQAFPVTRNHPPLPDSSAKRRHFAFLDPSGSGRRDACGTVDARITGNLPIFFAVEVHARLEADHLHGRVMVRP